MVLDLRFHHVGIACRDIAAEFALFECLGYIAEGPCFEDPCQRVRGMFAVSGSHRIELLEPICCREPSPLDSWLAKGIRLYQFAYESDHFDVDINRVRSCGLLMIGEPMPSVAFGGRKIVFFLMRNRLLLELIEGAVLNTRGK